MNKTNKLGKNTQTQANRSLNQARPQLMHGSQTGQKATISLQLIECNK